MATPTKRRKHKRLRVMVDANILIAGIGWPRFPYEVLQHAVFGDYLLVLTDFIIEEARTHITEILPSFLPNFEQFLVKSHYERVPSPTRAEVDAHHTLVRDAKDIPIALAAINTNVDFLISQDTDFTDKDASTEELHKQLTIILPGTFLREHMRWTSKQLEAIRKRTWKELEEQ
jgi:predicted nucleic acid-binding protein